MFVEAERLGLEGVVGKRADSPYVSEALADWIKVNAAKSDDFVVVGFSPAKQRCQRASARCCSRSIAKASSRTPVASAAASRSATSRRSSRCSTRSRLRSRPRRRPSERGDRLARAGSRDPGEVQAADAGWPLRQPDVLRLRDDKSRGRMRLAGALPNRAARRNPWPKRRPSTDTPTSAGPPARVDLTNLDKVFWPADGYTKGDLIELLPRHLGLAAAVPERPARRAHALSRTASTASRSSRKTRRSTRRSGCGSRRCGASTPSARSATSCSTTSSRSSTSRTWASIPLHVWSSRVAALERPDWCIVDLDPKGAPLTDVVKIARTSMISATKSGCQLREDERLDRPARADSARRALHVRAVAHAGRAHRACHGEVAARHRDDRTRRATATARSTRLPAERSRSAARRAVQRAAAAAARRCRCRSSGRT